MSWFFRFTDITGNPPQKASELVMAAELFRPGKVSGRDGTGQDFETLKVQWSRGPGAKNLKIGKVLGKCQHYQKRCFAWVRYMLQALYYKTGLFKYVAMYLNNRYA